VSSESYDGSVPENRHYSQRVRAAAAEETRRRILDTAREGLRTSPSERISVERVAHDAGVARSTVYLIFGSKAGLFEALGHDLLQRTGFDKLVTAVQLPDARDALRTAFAAAALMYAADRDVARAVYSMYALDPDSVRGVFEVVEHGRAEGQRRLAQRLHDQGHLLEEVAVDEAADVLWLLTSFDAFDQLYTGRSLPAKQVGERLYRLAARGLLRESGKHLRDGTRPGG